MLIYEAHDFEKKMGILVEKIKKSKENFKNDAKTYNQTSVKYQKVYHDLISTDNKATKKDKDFYNNEVKFKKAAIDQMESEKDYGKNIISFWNELRKLETHR